MSRTGFTALCALLVVAACTEGGITDDAKTGRTDHASARGSATLSWRAPTHNTDGSKLTDLTGYKIYYGTSKKYLQRVIVVDNPTATSYTIEDLPPLTYYVAMTAYNTAGAESERSDIRTKTIE